MKLARTFVACLLDPEATARVAEMAKRVRVHAEKAGARATWVRRENLHVSMKFLGDVEIARLEEIANALRAIAAKHAAFEVELGGVGSFPPRGRPRVLFVELASERLAAIARDVEEALAVQGFAREEKPYRAHVTIARVKEGKSFVKMVPEAFRLAAFGGSLNANGARASNANGARASNANGARARISSLTLFTSELTPAGPVYRIASDAPLR